jgi:hypothetical protein
MTGEIAIGGVLMPALLLLAALATIAGFLLSRLLNLLGLYRYVAHRPLIDCALVLLILGLLVRITSHLDSLP